MTVVGLIFFFVNLVLFIMTCILITLRFRFRPHTFKASFTDQVESLFTPAIVSLVHLVRLMSLVGN